MSEEGSDGMISCTVAAGEVCRTKVNIYYGGRGVIEDPTIYVLNKMTEVLKELRVEVNRYNIYEDRNAISTLPATLKGVDGIILGTTVEWFGIGGYMQQFLDMCWLYADKQQISRTYMLPVVMATTYGERDAELSLVKAWEMLGGIPLTGLAAYVENTDQFEKNDSYRIIIEKKTEALYRSINQKMMNLPTSNLAVKTNILKTRTIELTPQESEQLSRFASNENYVRQQKEDIEELSAMFKQMLSGNGEDAMEQEASPPAGEPYAKLPENDMEESNPVIDAFMQHYRPDPTFNASYAIIISDRDQILHLEATTEKLKCFYTGSKEADVILRTTSKVLQDILNGRTTFQKGFMAGEISAKGNFKTLRMLDSIFSFA